VRIARRNSVEAGRRAAAELLAGERRPTALLAMSDVLAMGALEAAAQVGLSVPADLSVVGFDDRPGARLASPPPTTVGQPPAEKGGLAAEWRTEDMARGTPAEGKPRRTILPPQLVVRSSAGPPP